MAKTSAVAAEPVENAGGLPLNIPAEADNPAATESAAPLSLTEFCTRLSERVRRPELIGAFEFVEIRAGRLHDTEAAYQTRFEEFTNKPV